MMEEIKNMPRRFRIPGVMRIATAATFLAPIWLFYMGQRNTGEPTHVD